LVISLAGIAIGLGTVWCYHVIARRIDRWADSFAVSFGLGEWMTLQRDKINDESRHTSDADERVRKSEPLTTIEVTT
jgi:hypothetical protein